MKKVLFIDRDGTLVKEPPGTKQVDSFEKLEFIPGMLTWLGKIACQLDFELVMVTNQDGLGTPSFPETDFWPVQDFLIKTLEGEGIIFREVLIDRSFAHELKNTRKPGTAMLRPYLEGDYDMTGSFVIGDRATDAMLAVNLGANAIMLGTPSPDIIVPENHVFIAAGWMDIYKYLVAEERKVVHFRKTRETEILIELNPDGTGKSDISTGLNFFDHMLEQLPQHGMTDLKLRVSGDLHVDEHHTIEDTGIALGEAIVIALRDKAGIERFGFVLPMDDCLAQVALDFGGRSWIDWEVVFTREMIGDVPTEMFFHFFKSFSDAAKCNLHIKAAGTNEHHKIEAVFKAFAKAVRMAITRNTDTKTIPSTKGKI